MPQGYGIQRKLLRSYMTVGGIGGFFLLLGLAMTLYLGSSVRRLAEVRTPIVQNAAHVREGLEASLAALRGWMVLDDPTFKTLRIKAWVETIEPAFAILKTFEGEWTDPKDIDRLHKLAPLLADLREFQWWIEEVAQSPGNQPARALINRDVQPVAEGIFSAITAMIEFEKELPSGAERKSLLGNMADFRGWFERSLEALDVFVASGVESNWEQFRGYRETTSRKLNGIGERTALLTSDQNDLYRWIKEEFKAYEILANEVNDRRLATDWNVSQYLLRKEALPRARQIRTVLAELSKYQEVFMETEALSVAGFARSAIGISLTLIVGMFFLVWSVSKLGAEQITRPILALSHATQELEAGTLDHDIPVTSEDEIGLLTTSFNRMRASLQESRAQIERENAERKVAEARFRLVVESSPDGLVMVDKDGTIALVNEQTEVLFGNTREELVGQPVEVLVPERFRQQHEKDRENYIWNPEPRRMGEGRDLFGLRKDGTEFPVEIGLSPLVLDEGIFVLGAISDITERKRFEEELRTNRDYLRALVDNIPDVVYLKDRKSRYLLCNKATVEYHERSSEDEFIGKTDFDLISKPRAERRYVEEQELMGSGEAIVNREGYYVDSHGREHWTLSSLFPLGDERGRGYAILGIHHDVTERMKAEIELERTTEELKRSNTELEQFAYIASHDLQEPLRMVVSYLQLIQRRYEGKLDKKADDFIGFAVDGAMRMKTLINDLLTYSRVGTQDKSFEPVEVSEVVDAALKNLKVAIAESQTKVTLGSLPRVIGDPVRLAQLFQNLIGNAIKFRGEKSPEISIDAESREHEWLISVQDNGVGFDSEYCDQIFQVFQRLHTREEAPGTGIGLAICKKIVERHSGRIWAESVEGEGSIFRFTLPTRGDKA